MKPALNPGPRNSTLKAVRRCLAPCLVAAGLMLAALPAASVDDDRFRWPNGARAAVNLAYDDALATQLDHVIPALNEREFRGSFYVPAGAPLLTERLDEWRAAAEQGHELGNHSLFHHCDKQRPGREWVEPHRDLSQLPVAAFAEQIALANDFLKLIDGRDERTFTPPCGDTTVDDRDYLTPVKPLFIGAKGIGDSGVVASMEDLDPYAVPVVAPADWSGEELIAVVEEAARRGTMANFTFHGVGGDHLAVSEKAHTELLDHLAEHPDRFWVDSFINIMRHVNQP